MENLALTSFSRHGGCSCKLDATSLGELCSLPELKAAMPVDQEADDAAILPIDAERALVTSIDYQNVIVDDGELAGEIAARNALSDIFACGVHPMFANVVLIVPYGEQGLEIGKSLMRGVARACMEDQCAIVGGHTIEGDVPIVGLSVSSIAPLQHIKRKSGARPGDILILTKPIGSGIAISARQSGAFSDLNFAKALEVLRHSNRVGAVLGLNDEVSAMTDITGFGLLGHMCEIAENSGVTLRLQFGQLPILPGTAAAARDGLVPSLAEANLRSFEAKVRFKKGDGRHERLILCDPQTNGGLLIAVRPGAVAAVVAAIEADGLSATTVGEVLPRSADGSLVDIAE